MKSILLSILSAFAFVGFVTSARAQNIPAPNALYLELGGNGLLYTLNYDRMISDDLGLRLGAGYLGVSANTGPDAEGSPTTTTASVLIVPLTLNYFLASHTKGKVGSSKLELGAGPVLLNLSASVSGSAGKLGSGSGTFLAGTATVGYRYQPSDGGFVFRVAFTPLYNSQAGFLPWAGLSLGYGF